MKRLKFSVVLLSIGCAYSLNSFAEMQQNKDAEPEVCTDPNGCINLEAELDFARMFPFEEARPRGDKWLAKGDVKNAVQFYEIYFNAIVAEINGIRDNGGFIRADSDHMERIERIANKLYAAGAIEESMKFDKELILLHSGVEGSIVNKWLSRSKEFAADFEMDYVKKNPMEAKVRADAWFNANDMDRAFSLYGIYVNHILNEFKSNLENGGSVPKNSNRVNSLAVIANKYFMGNRIDQAVDLDKKIMSLDEGRRKDILEKWLKRGNGYFERYFVPKKDEAIKSKGSF